MAKTQTAHSTQVVISQTLPRISHVELLQMLYGVKGATFVSAEIWTEPAFQGKKADNRFWNSFNGTSRVVKRGRPFGMIGFIYQNVINNAQDREVVQAARENGIGQEQLETFLGGLGKGVGDLKDGEFKPAKHKWAIHCDNPVQGGTSRIVMMKEKNPDENRYMMLWCMGTKFAEYRWADTREKLDDGDLVELSPWLKGKSSNAKHQGLCVENEVVIRTPSIFNVSEIQIGGKNYQVI
jgi:hypothetical protein